MHIFDTAERGFVVWHEEAISLTALIEGLLIGQESLRLLELHLLLLGFVHKEVDCLKGSKIGY